MNTKINMIRYLLEYENLTTEEVARELVMSKDAVDRVYSRYYADATPFVTRKVRELLKKGCPHAEISRLADCSIRYVDKVAEDAIHKPKNLNCLGNPYESFEIEFVHRVIELSETINKSGRRPTQREIAARAKVSPSTVYRILFMLRVYKNGNLDDIFLHEKNISYPLYRAFLSVMSKKDELLKIEEASNEPSCEESDYEPFSIEHLTIVSADDFTLECRDDNTCMFYSEKHGVRFTCPKESIAFIAQTFAKLADIDIDRR